MYNFQLQDNNALPSAVCGEPELGNPGGGSCKQGIATVHVLLLKGSVLERRRTSKGTSHFPWEGVAWNGEF